MESTSVSRARAALAARNPLSATALLQRLAAVAGRPDRAAARRVASIVLVGRDRGQEGVSESIIVAQERAAEAAGQFFRRSANEASPTSPTAAASAAAPMRRISRALSSRCSSRRRDGRPSQRSTRAGACWRASATAKRLDSSTSTCTATPASPSLNPMAEYCSRRMHRWCEQTSRDAADRRLGPAHPRRQPRRRSAGTHLRRRRRAASSRPTDSGGGRGTARRRARAAAGRGSSGSVGAAVPHVTDGVARVVSWAPVAGRVRPARLAGRSSSSTRGRARRARCPLPHARDGLRGDPDPRRPRRVRLDLASCPSTARPPRGRGRARRLRGPQPGGSRRALRRGRPDRPCAGTASTSAHRPTRSRLGPPPHGGSGVDSDEGNGD